MARLAIIARADLTGLGVQSRNWVRLLNPQKVIVINSQVFNKNEQHFEWYGKYNAYRVDGFIQSSHIPTILRDIDVVLTFEIPYNYLLISAARARGVKTIIQNNWEFTDYLRQHDLPLPDLLVNHSYWHLDDQKARWPEITEYCATPIFIEDYEEIYERNINRTLLMPRPPAKKPVRRFLHIAGRQTYNDRNGTNDLLEAVKLIPEDVKFELVIKTQTAAVGDITDPRIIIDRSSPLDEKELYRDFDAMIMPRRYAGACLPMTEALASGLPVIMTDIDPNDKVLPKGWLVKSEKKSSFMVRTDIDVYSADHNALAEKIIELASIKGSNMHSQKLLAREIAVKEYSSEVIKEKWTGLLSKIGL